jgi:hypothetical protein
MKCQGLSRQDKNHPRYHGVSAIPVGTCED